MAKNTKTPVYTVDMPEKGIVFKKTNKNSDDIYAYYATRYYRNENGRPTTTRVSIGKKDPFTGKLIPNDNYYELFDVQPQIVTQPIHNLKVIDYGHYALINKCVKDYNIQNILDASFDSDYKGILSLAFYMLLEGSTINGCDIWFEKNYNYLDKPLSSQRASELFASISLQKRLQFFKLWKGYLNDNEYVSYDVTSLSSYTRNMNIFEYGYNRDNENLPQINMAMFFGEESKLPIFYNLYNGSINDKSDFLKIMEHTDALDITNIRYIMDRGFYSKQNISYLMKNKKLFLMAVENRLTFIQKMILENYSTIARIENHIENTEYYSIRRDYFNPNNKKEKLDVYLIFNYERKQDELMAQIRKLKTYEKELIELSTIEIKNLTDLNLSKYQPYFDMSVKDKHLVFSKNEGRINDEGNTFGFFAFISNDPSITPMKVLATYKKRGDIEQTFDGLKNSIDMKRLKTHSNETTEGKIFVAFISLILKSIISNKLNDTIVHYKKLSEEEKKTHTNLSYYNPKLLLKELSKIQITNAYGKTTLCLPLTKKQKEIYHLYQLDEQKLKRECPELN